MALLLVHRTGTNNPPASVAARAQPSSERGSACVCSAVRECCSRPSHQTRFADRDISRHLGAISVPSRRHLDAISVPSRCHHADIWPSIDLQSRTHLDPTARNASVAITLDGRQRHWRLRQRWRHCGLLQQSCCLHCSALRRRARQSIRHRSRIEEGRLLRSWRDRCPPSFVVGGVL